MEAGCPDDDLAPRVVLVGEEGVEGLAPDHGVHAGFAIGARGLRTRCVFPGAAVGISWERTFLDGADATTIKIGARVAFDLEL